MKLSQTVMRNMKKTFRTMSLTKLNEILEGEKRAIELLKQNNRATQSNTFSHRQKIQLIEEEIKIRSKNNELSI